MLSIFGGREKKGKRTDELKQGKRLQNAKELFITGKFPVVTTPLIKGAGSPGARTGQRPGL